MKYKKLYTTKQLYLDVRNQVRFFNPKKITLLAKKISEKRDISFSDFIRESLVKNIKYYAEIIGDEKIKKNAKRIPANGKLLDSF